jgi:putative amino-acid transport system ATP-binding protein
MADGHIVEQGTPEQIFNDPQDIQLKKFLNQVGIE